MVFQKFRSAVRKYRLGILMNPVSRLLKVVGEVKKVGKSRNFEPRVGKSRNFSIFKVGTES